MRIENIPIVFENIDYENQRTKSRFECYQKDKETDTLLKGAVFWVYMPVKIFMVLKTPHVQ